MFVCLECGHVFEEPKSYVETHGLDSPPYENSKGCPICCGAYVEAYRCNCCEEWIDDIYIKTDDDYRYCLNCYQVLHLGDED